MDTFAPRPSNSAAAGWSAQRSGIFDEQPVPGWAQALQRLRAGDYVPPPSAMYLLAQAQTTCTLGHGTECLYRQVPCPPFEEAILEAEPLPPDYYDERSQQLRALLGREQFARALAGAVPAMRGLRGAADRLAQAVIIMIRAL